MQVDQSVTQHLDRELSRSAQWDVLILHYLGLDHIGHLEGPDSSLIAPKLAEMDAVVKKIHTALQAQVQLMFLGMLVGCQCNSSLLYLCKNLYSVILFTLIFM